MGGFEVFAAHALHALCEGGKRGGEGLQIGQRCRRIGGGEKRLDVGPVAGAQSDGEQGIETCDGVPC